MEKYIKYGFLYFLYTLHNAIIHPIVPFLPRRWANWLHDVTAVFPGPFPSAEVTPPFDDDLDGLLASADHWESNPFDQCDEDEYTEEDVAEMMYCVLNCDEDACVCNSAMREGRTEYTLGQGWVTK